MRNDSTATKGLSDVIRVRAGSPTSLLTAVLRRVPAGRVVADAKPGPGLLGICVVRYQRMKVFFACTYYSGLRPEEVNALHRPDVTLPDCDDPDGWGEFLLSAADPESGRSWAEGKRSPRQLKHRAPGDTRLVPIPPPLVAIIRWHVAAFGWTPSGRLVSAMTSDGPIASGTYGRAFHAARVAAFTAEQGASLLARSPYDLRHACLSGWLNAGVPPTQVAEWAGHTVEMLLATYTKCVDGQDEIAKRRIAEALGQDDIKAASEPPEVLDHEDAADA